MRASRRRSAFTVMELLVVIAVIVILGAILVPSLIGFWSNNRTKAAADIATARLSDARGAAIAQGIPYRVCVSPNGLQVRVCPDQSGLTEQLAFDTTTVPVQRVDTLPKGVVLTPIYTGIDGVIPANDGWITLVTFLPDGTCREDASEFVLSEPEVTPLVVRVRGLTGVWAVNPGMNNLSATTGVTTMGGMP